MLFAGEKVRADDHEAVPQIANLYVKDRIAFLPLDQLVRMKLTAFRDKDRTHLRDFLEVGLVDSTWLTKLPPELATRLQQLIDTPDG